MSCRKRVSDSALSTSSKKRKVTVTTFNKWKTQFERDYNTLSWLHCDVGKEDKTIVEVLWCEACRKHEERITGMKNFSRVWITGSSNQKTSNVVDHATSEQHRVAMARVRTEAAKALNQPLTTYFPIAHSLLVMDKTHEMSDHVQPNFGLVWHYIRSSLWNYNDHWCPTLKSWEWPGTCKTMFGGKHPPDSH